MTGAIERRALARKALQRRAERAIAEVAPALVEGQIGAGLTAGQLAAITEALARRSAGSIDMTKRTLQVLGQSLRQLQRQTGGKVAMPEVPVTLRRRPSPFVPTKVAQAACLSRLMGAFLDSLCEAPRADAKLSASRIALSAILFGGLIHGRLVAALPGAVGASFYAEGALCWCDLDVHADADPGAIRRWFPDPVTQCLILHWRHRGLAWPSAGVRKMAVDLVEELARRVGTYALSWTDLLASSQTRLRLELPAVLVDFLASPQHGQSLPARA
ncbi:MAG TPA: hypothetical protein VFQ88_00110 [Nevskiaceae bacterium]|nr:hypothetical protein [Nevskiaceae bacterium]